MKCFNCIFWKNNNCELQLLPKYCNEYIPIGGYYAI